MSNQIIALNLRKGEMLNLTKEHATLTALSVACGWDINTATNSTESFDLDVSVLALTNGRLANTNDVVFFGRKDAPGIHHTGDNLTGAGEGDDETIRINLAELNANFTELLFVINIYEATKRNQRFSDVKNAFIRAYNTTTNEEICRFELSGENHTENAMIVGKLQKTNGEWHFVAIGEATTGDLNQICNRFSS